MLTQRELRSGCSFIRETSCLLKERMGGVVPQVMKGLHLIRDLSPKGRDNMEGSIHAWLHRCMSTRVQNNWWYIKRNNYQWWYCKRLLHGMEMVGRMWRKPNRLQEHRSRSTGGGSKLQGGGEVPGRCKFEVFNLL